MTGAIACGDGLAVGRNGQRFHAVDAALGEEIPAAGHVPNLHLARQAGSSASDHEPLIIRGERQGQYLLINGGAERNRRLDKCLRLAQGNSFLGLAAEPAGKSEKGGQPGSDHGDAQEERAEAAAQSICVDSGSPTARSRAMDVGGASVAFHAEYVPTDLPIVADLAAADRAAKPRFGTCERRVANEHDA